MEVKNGIIIDGVLHEATYGANSCDECSLVDLCYNDGLSALCSGIFDCGIFVNRGKVKAEKEETE